jgi:alkanesulfonate monooxygenase SsuD/methylene tetrahydromethanopterin reductase-like flavin-dependent oxidoreductase (luciferase family)
METHGWLDTAERLGMMAARQQWSDMAALIDDEMLEAFAVTGAPDELAGLIQRRYAGLLDRINYYVPFVPGESDDYWRRVAAAFHA